ncbi:hypothetical protein, conserved [Eimeria maxima]|uniref:Uncharacterized protein n=1 Tax=Eimeria maxima TaxID=5804 RepID=U6M7U4_EIMMA|nr:hypothetical protein, conserved [Eimeria maxima]CDJ59133.1 hypothetical protein, conserved [Eimeria maxima]
MGLNKKLQQLRHSAAAAAAVRRFIVKDSVEQRIAQLHKTRIASKTPSEALLCERLSLEDLHELLQIGRKEAAANPAAAASPAAAAAAAARAEAPAASTAAGAAAAAEAFCGERSLECLAADPQAGDYTAAETTGTGAETTTDAIPSTAAGSSALRLLQGVSGTQEVDQEARWSEAAAAAASDKADALQSFLEDV